VAKGYKTGGRRKGVGNHDGDAIRKYAQKYGKKAIDELATQMQTAPEKAVRVSAANALLDRGFGKPTQPLGGDVNNPIIVKLQGNDKDL
jgi:hypothetical protein